MKRISKRKFHRFCAVMIIALAALVFLPKAKTDVRAASSPPIQVEQGQEFYVGDYITMWKGDINVTASMVNASYTSDNPSVASVDNNGYFTAKETGITTLTVKYKKQKETEKIEVVPAGTFAVSDADTNLKKRAGELANQIPSSISIKNGFQLNQLKCNYEKANSGSISYISNDGFLQKKNTSKGALTKYIRTEKLVVPQAGRYNTLDLMLDEFCGKNWPPQIKSVVSATNVKITAKLKKKFTEKHFLAMYISGLDGNDKLKKKSKKAYNSIHIFDLNVPKMYDYGRNYKRYYGIITYKKGSNIITIQPYTDTSKSLMYVKKGKKTKLIKGHTYRLTDYAGDSSKGKTFTLK